MRGYLPDVAETFALLAEQEGALDAFATYHFEGHWDPNGTAMTAAIATALNRPGLKVKRLPRGHSAVCCAIQRDGARIARDEALMARARTARQSKAGRRSRPRAANTARRGSHASRNRGSLAHLFRSTDKERIGGLPANTRS